MSAREVAEAPPPIRPVRIQARCNMNLSDLRQPIARHEPALAALEALIQVEGPSVADLSFVDLPGNRAIMMPAYV